MKSPLLALVTVLVLPALGLAMEFPFQTTTDYDAALERAGEQDKPVMVAFVHEQCGHCQRLKEEVFGTDEFAQFAEENLVPVVYDFATLNKLPEDQRQTARDLAKQHQVTGTPTLLLLKPNGEVIMKNVGYGGADPEQYISQLKERVSAETSLLENS